MLENLRNKMATAALEFGLRHAPAAGRLGQACFQYGIKSAPEFFEAKINAKVAAVAPRAVMKIMEQEGLLHCEFCPNRASLRKVGKTYVCPKHFKPDLKP